MNLTELTLEVRDPSFQRIGQITDVDLVGSRFIMRYNGVGDWQINLSGQARLVEQLRTPGYGIVLTGPQGVILSGPTISAELKQSTKDPEGMWVIKGASDALILQERLAYPQPDNADVTTQNIAYDTRTGAAETVIKGYVADNIGKDSGTVRAIPYLNIEADQGRGETVTGNARFKQLQELLLPLAQTGQIAYDIKAMGDELEFVVYEPQDLSSTIRMDIDNGRLAATQYNYSTPQATRVIVAGAGEAVERLFVESTSPDSLSSETAWNRRIERFIDARDTEDSAILDQRGQEKLVELGKTIVNLSVTPTDSATMRYGYDWNLGDLVTVVVGETEAVAIVTEVGIAIGDDGVRVIATVGPPTPVEFETEIIEKVEDQNTRIGNLERNTTGYGVNTVYQPNGGTIGGTQPTASGPFISGSFNRFGNMVHFNIQVDMDNMTSFGTGQYYVTLPYPARVRYTFANGHLLDFSANKTYNLVGECAADSDIIKIYYIGPNGQMDAFDHNSPVNLTIEDYFDISGTYEIEG